MPEVYYEISAFMGSLIDIYGPTSVLLAFIGLMVTGVLMGMRYDKNLPNPPRLAIAGVIVASTFFIVASLFLSVLSVAWKNMPLIYRIIGH